MELKIDVREVLWETWTKEGVPVWAITSDFYRNTYKLYKVKNNGELQPTNHRAKDPTKLHPFCTM